MRSERIKKHRSTRRIIAGLLIALGGVCDHARADASPSKERGEPADASTAAYGIEKRTLWTTSRVIGRPDPPPPYTSRRAFPNLTFESPLHLIAGPEGKRIYVTERNGRIVSFLDNPDTKETSVFLEPDFPLYAIIFHPGFKENRHVYTFGNLGPDRKKGRDGLNRITRYEVNRDDPPQCIAGSALRILEYGSEGHDGGTMQFGSDGYLYVSTGDGTGDSDGWLSGQDLFMLNATVLRIDVDHPDAGKAYGIPDDNPFRNHPEARPEIWAYGFRNPWRMWIDPPTGEMWIGDVGQDLWEMIYLVRRGGNYGWSVNEGSHPFYPNRQRGPTPILPPIAEHSHSEARSITGGIVYRGKRLNELVGAYIYADYETGKIWGLRHENGKATWHEELADTVLKIASFGTGPDGEMYLVEHLAGEIHQLQPAPPNRQERPFPRRLSETGLFESVADLRPAAGLIPYTVNAPLWADNAHKERTIALPGESRITYLATGTWTFPEGSVLVESFSLDMEEGNPDSRKRIETRILTLQQGQWHGYTYIWNDEQTDAELAPADGVDRTYTIRDPGTPSGERTQLWRFPSRADCMICHSRAAGFLLGLSTAQMNKMHDYGSVRDNQLRTLEHIGVFTGPLPDRPEKLARLANPYDESADLDARARAYLHANCSHCHIMAGGGNSKMSLSFTTKLEKTGIVDEPPQHTNFGIRSARLAAPGDPDRSILSYRMSLRGKGQMPLLATTRVDEPALRLIREWIAGMKSPEPEKTEAASK